MSTHEMGTVSAETLTDIESAIDVLRPSFEADGFSLKVESVGADGAVVVALSVESEDACGDCLVPDATLVSILESSIREKHPDVPGVSLRKYNF